MNKKEIQNIIKENERRLKELESPYDPHKGIGSPIERFELKFTNKESLYLPKQMLEDELIFVLSKQKNAYDYLKKNFEGADELYYELLSDIFDKRLKYDFEFWAVTCMTIPDKESDKRIPFKLNRPQRKLLGVLEDMRIRGVPIRVIIAKARQWGGSTLVQSYIVWIQLMIKENWHSAIIADVEDQAKHIQGFCETIVENHPKEVASFTISPYQRSTKVRYINERGNIVGVGSAQKPESTRTYDYRMVHMSEVGFWKDTEKKSAEDLTQSIRASIPQIPYTLSVMESTAKGLGFFYREWRESTEGKSGYKPVFVGWWEIERYQKKIEGFYKAFIEQMNDYDWYLWSLGATLEGIHWYNHFRDTENYSEWRMNSEFPSDAQEAFQSSGRKVFNPAYVRKLNRTVKKPEYIGELSADSDKGKSALKNIEFYKQNRGNLYVWSLPDKEEPIANRYALFADIGGRTASADWSVISVMDRYWMMHAGVPEIVATYRCHMDQDLFAWKAAQLATFYNKGLLAIETNSLRKEKVSTEGDHFYTILDEIGDYYDNLFMRETPENIKDIPRKYGFHTNPSSKGLIIDTLNATMREEAFIERDIRAIEEYARYEHKEDGSMGAVEGEHDDIVITRAGVVWLSLNYMDAPKKIDERPKRSGKKLVSEASY